MKVLRPENYLTMEIDAAGVAKFESFLDRNFPGWREKESARTKNARGIHRKWRIGHDGIDRNAMYRKQFVEVFDEYFDDDDCENIQIETLKHFIYDLDGDLTPVAVWGK